MNATAICRANGKLFADYGRRASSAAYLMALSSAMGIPIADLVITNMGGLQDVKGTWIHPRDAIDLARWCPLSIPSAGGGKFFANWIKYQFEPI